MKKILIIKAGSTFPDLKKQVGDFEHWIIESSGLPPSAFFVLSVEDTLPLPKELSLFRAAIITGSHSMVTDPLPWLPKTIHLIEKLRQQAIPTLGICFGHQLLAQTFGGTVGNNPSGPEYGAVQIHLTEFATTDLLFAQMSTPFWAFMSHHQSVLTLPPQAIKLAGSAKDYHAAFFLPPAIWGIQFHPEFTVSIMKFYLRHYYHVSESNIAKYLNSTPQANSLIANFLALEPQMPTHHGASCY